MTYRTVFATTRVDGYAHDFVFVLAGNDANQEFGPDLASAHPEASPVIS